MNTNQNASPHDGDLVYSGQSWIAEALATHEEHIKRRRSCTGGPDQTEPMLGLNHSWRTFSAAGGGPQYTACWRCRVTRTDEDFRSQVHAR